MSGISKRQDYDQKYRSPCKVRTWPIVTPLFGLIRVRLGFEVRVRNGAIFGWSGLRQRACLDLYSVNKYSVYKLCMCDKMYLHLYMLQLLCAAVIQYERLKGVQSSGVLFIYWLLALVCATVTLRSKILQSIDQVSFEHEYKYFIITKYNIIQSFMPFQAFYSIYMETYHFLHLLRSSSGCTISVLPDWPTTPLQCSH